MWKTMDSAPKDGAKILLWHRIEGMYIGYWEKDPSSPWGGNWKVVSNRYYPCGCCCPTEEPNADYWADLPDEKVCKNMLYESWRKK